MNTEPTTLISAVCRRNDDVLLVPENVSFPPYCVRCGKPARPIAQGYGCSPPPVPSWLLVLALALVAASVPSIAEFGLPLALVPGIVAYLLVRKRVRVLVPLCDEHLRSFKRLGNLSAVLVAASVPSGIIAEFGLPTNLKEWGIGILIGAAVFVSGLVLLWARKPLRLLYVGDGYASFKGAGSGFLSRIERATDIPKLLKVWFSRRKRLAGVKGWLLLLCIFMLAVRPIMNMLKWALLYSSLSEVHSYDSGVQSLIATTALILGDTALATLGGLALWRKNRWGVRVAKWFFLYIVVEAFATPILSMLTLPLLPISTWWKASYLSIVWASVWLIYLNNSERIRDTYFPEDAAPHESFPLLGKANSGLPTNSREDRKAIF
jgi:hypothetical protein